MSQESKPLTSEEEIKQSLIFRLDPQRIRELTPADNMFQGKFVVVDNEVFVAPRNAMEIGHMIDIYHKDIALKAHEDLGLETPNLAKTAQASIPNDFIGHIKDAGTFYVQSNLVTVFGESSLFGRGDNEERQKTAQKFEQAFHPTYRIRFP